MEVRMSTAWYLADLTLPALLREDSPKVLFLMVVSRNTPSRSYFWFTISACMRERALSKAKEREEARKRRSRAQTKETDQQAGR